MADHDDNQPLTKKQKLTKSPWDGWKHFSRERTQDTENKCLHCDKDVQNRQNVAKRHLEKCDAYLEYQKAVGASSVTTQKKSFVQPTTDLEKRELKELQIQYAECVYVNGLSHNSMTAKLWHKFFERLHPKFKLPTRDQLDNEYLDTCYKRIQQKIEVFVDRKEYLSLVIDGWTNERQEAIINIITMTPEPIFLKTIDTRGATKDVDYMFEQLEIVICKLDKSKITSLISDNEAKMRLFARTVRAKYKHIIFSGCVAHKLNTMVRHICNLAPIKKCLEDAKEIVKEINGHQKLLAKFREMIVADVGKTFGGLKSFPETRFSCCVFMIDSIIKAINPLRFLASDSSNNLSHPSKMKILSIGAHKDFYGNMTQVAYLLKPISDCIHKVESDGSSLADMVEEIKKLETAFDSRVPFLDAYQKESVKKLFDTCMKKCKSPSSLLANLLHPHYRGKNLKSDEKFLASSFVTEFASQLDMNAQKISQSYCQFVNKEGYFSHPSLDAINPSNGISWWKFVRNNSDHKSLSQVALRLLYIQPTNTAVERSLSAQNYVHHKERNRLRADRVNKLMFIKRNVATLNGIADFDPSNSVVESELSEFSDSE